MTIKVMLIATLITVLIGSVALAQNTSQPPPPAANMTGNLVLESDILGELDGRVYTNRFFNLVVSVPENFTILNRNEIEIYSKAGADAIGGKDNNRSKTFDLAVNNTIDLFAVSQKPAGSPDNSAIEFVAIKQPMTATANLALAATVKVMTGTDKYTVTQNLKDTTIGGRLFSGVEFETNAFGPTLRQRTFVTMQKGYSIMISVLSASEDGLLAFDEMLKSLRFGLN